MSDPVADSVNDIGQQSQRGPGRSLREAREARRWTQEHVAGQMRLPLRVVQGLEQDDYQRLPPPAFVRGYLRNYARLVELPEHEVVKQYLSSQRDIEDPRLPHATAPTQITSSDRRVRWVTYLVAISVIALPLIWWKAQWSPVQVPGTEQPSPTAGQAAESAQAPPEAAVVPDGAAVQPATPGDGMPGGGGHSVPEQDAGVGADSTVLQAENAEAAAEEAATPVTNGATPPGIPAPAKQDTVVLHFEGESWAQIVDGEGQRLLFETGSKGSTKTVQGKPPFKVVIGKSDAVKVEYNGQPFDHKFSEKKGVARFELGATDGPHAPPAPPASPVPVE